MKINLITISDDLSEIKVNVSNNTVPLQSGPYIVNLYIWNSETYGFDTKKIDLSNLLIPNSYEQEFSIKLSDTPFDSFNGIFYLKFSDENGKYSEGVVANFTSYQECITNELLKLNFSDCGCLENNDCIEKLFSTNTLLQVVITELKLKVLDCDCGVTCVDFSDINKLISSLNGMCNKCKAKQKSTTNKKGYSFGMYNDKLIDEIDTNNDCNECN